MSVHMIVFVIGTGTDVGKTHVTAALRQLSPSFAAWKPIATGTSDAFGDDARAIEAVEPPLYAFRPPISPHLAARQAGVTITVGTIVREAQRIATKFEILFVESAGGLFSPISNTESNFDIAHLLRAQRGVRVLLVAPDRIGVLHDVAASVRDLAPNVVALSAPAHPDASTGTNAAEISTLRLAKHVVEFPRAAPAESHDAAARCLALLQ